MEIVFIEPLGMSEEAVRAACRPLETQGHTIQFYNDRVEDEGILISRAQNAQIVVISNIPLKKSFFDACPNLKMLSVAFTGTDHIDITECHKKGIVVSNAAGYSTEAVAELALGMIFATYRKIVGGDAITRIGGDRQNFLGTELAGKTVGIIGTGAIGLRFAQLTNAFGCKILAYNRTHKDVDYIRFVDKDTLLQESDIVSLHLPLTESTRNFIDSRDFGLMKPTGILINTARGLIVNQEALYSALRKGVIAGAATDVYEKEPPLPANSELYSAPNLLMLPHMGYATKESFTSRLQIVVRNVEQWINGTPQNVIK